MSENEENGHTMSENEENGHTMSETQMEEKPAPVAENGAPKPEKLRNRILRCTGAVLFGLIFLFAGIIAGWIMGTGSVDERAKDLAWLVERVEANYYKEIDDDTLYDYLFSALELDRFCTYYNVDEYDRLVSESMGSNEGYGLSLVYEENEDGTESVRVYRTVYNSPVERAGLEPGMYIYRFGEGETLEAATPDNFYDYLISHDGVTVEAGFSEDKTARYTFSRAAYAGAYCEYRDSEKSFRFRGEKKLTLEEVGDGLSVLDGDTAYLRLTEFDGKASEEFEACLKKMKERGRKNLVLDLRSNGGGYLSTLCGIASHLLKNAEGNHPLVATSRFRNGREDRYTADGNDYDEYFSDDARIRVLADENTASASEALMGAMLDYGTISAEDIYLRVSMYGGEEVAKTYGKGVMQSAFVTPEGRALRLTVAEIFWPNGNSIHDVGIRAEGDHAIKADLLASAEEFLGMLS